MDEVSINSSVYILTEGMCFMRITDPPDARWHCTNAFLKRATERDETCKLS